MDAPRSTDASERIVLAGIVAASACVLVAALGASFRLPFGEGLTANGARFSTMAAAGAALAISGAIRRVRGAEEGAAFELSTCGAAAFAAAGAAIGAGVLSAAPEVGALVFAIVGAAVAVGLVRVCDRPARLANLGAGLFLAAFIAAAALSASFGQGGEGPVSSAIAWLLGDTAAGATGASAVASVVLALSVLGVAILAAWQGEAGLGLFGLVGPVALGLAFGLAGVLAFIGSFVPRTVRALAPHASPVALIVVSALAGAASVAAIDTVPRLLIGGYALPFAVSTGMLAVPIYLTWNRRRLRQLAGPTHVAVEVIEGVAITLGTLVALALALFLTQIVRGAT